MGIRAPHLSQIAVMPHLIAITPVLNDCPPTLTAASAIFSIPAMSVCVPTPCWRSSISDPKAHTKQTSIASLSLSHRKVLLRRCPFLLHKLISFSSPSLLHKLPFFSSHYLLHGLLFFPVPILYIGCCSLPSRLTNPESLGSNPLECNIVTLFAFGGFISWLCPQRNENPRKWKQKEMYG